MPFGELLKHVEDIDYVEDTVDGIKYETEIDCEVVNENCIRVTVTVGTGKFFETEAGYMFEKSPDNTVTPY
ncbi:hypothetical protein ACFL54_05385 [Planctomycetota bacterium]